jgi:hypothetical protein
MLGLCVLFGVWRALKSSYLMSTRVIENLLIAAAFAGVYLLLPREYPDAGYVDVRALVMVCLSLLIASIWLAHPLGGAGYGTLAVRVFALLLVALNLGWIAENLRPLESWMSRYRQVVAAVPAGSRVLPVATRPSVGGLSSTLHTGATLHAGSYLTIDRYALMPYLFSRNRGDPMNYFYYRARPYMPAEQWYARQLTWRAGVPRTYTVLGERYTWRFRYSERDKAWEALPLVPVNWARVACDYDWLLVTRPYDAKLIEIATEVVRENDAASLLRSLPGRCSRIEG